MAKLLLIQLRMLPDIIHTLFIIGHCCSFQHRLAAFILGNLKPSEIEITWF